MTDERKPLWPWVVALLIGLPVLYAASFGPACWISSRVPSLTAPVESAYAPLARISWSLPTTAMNAFYRWGRIGESDRSVSRHIILSAIPDEVYERLTVRPRISR